jgi:hypothetical protein
MPYGTVNADVIQTSTSGGILGAGNASIMKNRIINGAMVIDQRNAGASISTASGTNTYTLDRWQTNYSQTSKYTIQQNAGSVTPPIGFKNYLGITSSSAYSVLAGDFFLLRQKIEGFNIADLGWGTANAKTITLSFQVYSSLTGTFGGALNNNGDSRSYPFTYTVSTANTWTSISVTIAGDTSGTWEATTSTGIALTFGIGVGTTYSGTAGSWSANTYYSATGATSVVGTNGATFYITGVQLEVGSSATGFEYVNYETSLANCQRYYEVLVYDTNGQAGMSAPFSTVADSRFQWLFKVQKRANPSYSVVSGSWGGNTPSAYFSVSHIQFVTNGTYFFLTGSGGSTAISASAEL